MSQLLQVEDAVNNILAHIPEPKVESVHIEQALGRVLADEITAPTSLPPFPNSAMDGYAVRADDVQHGSAALTVTMDIPAGYAPTEPIKQGQAARIMTGAPIPPGADAVVPVEDTDTQFEDKANAPLPERIKVLKAFKPGDNIRQAGESIRKDDSVLARSTIVQPQDIGMLAGLGIAHIPVYSKPHAAIIATGDELIPVEQPLTPGKIRDTNSLAIAALVQSNGGTAVRIPPARDTFDAVRSAFQQAFDTNPDVIVSTAGVSVGTRDVVRDIVEEMGELNFWRVNVRPGKPLAFGHVRGVPFFGLPGNPVSSMVTFDLFVRPAIRKIGGLTDTPRIIEATLTESMKSDGRRTYARVTLHQQDGHWYATSTGTQSSGALMSMVLADGLLVIPEGTTVAQPGQKFPVRLLRE